jgi:hypothetical protein
VASGISIQVQGLAQLQKKMGKLPEVLVDQLDAEMSAVGDEYVDRVTAAITSAGAIDEGRLKGGTSKKRMAVLHYEIVNNVFYAAYVEWGTVSYVSVPAELQAYAMQFKGQGIIKNGGMRARPFFFPHIPWAIGELNKQLAAAVKVALSK